MILHFDSIRSAGRAPFAGRKWLLALVLLIVQSATIVVAATSSKQTSLVPDGTLTNLTLRGYNYTSRYIDGFSADGQGGGNLYVSGPSSGGGSSVCCVNYVKGATAPQVIIRWQSGGCTYRVPGLADGMTHFTHGFYREVKVRVSDRIPDSPVYFEVHFYPDGQVEAAITDRISSPRLVLSKDRVDRSDFPRCPHDQEPT
jgi:hypothetical protein